MPASIIDIDTAGNGLFRVTIKDEQGTSDREVTVPDGMMEDLLGDEAGDFALRDLAWAAMAWQLRREAPENIPARLELEELRGTADFDTEVPALVRGRAQAAEAASHGKQESSAVTDSNDRLVQEVRDEQAAGEASTPRDTY